MKARLLSPGEEKAFNAKTEEQLTRIRNNFAEIAQSIFENTYLKPFNGNHKSDLYQAPVERISHGVQHVVRVSLYIRILINYFRSLGYPESIMKLTESEITLLELAALFHDAARKNDRYEDTWESDSAGLFEDFLRAHDITEEKALHFSQYITREREDILNDLLQSADSLDIMRVKRSLQLEKINLFNQLDPKDHHSFLNLAIEIRDLIARQHDLKHDCNITHEGVEVSKPLAKTRNEKQPELKRDYEQARQAYTTLRDTLKDQPALEKFYDTSTKAQDLSISSLNKAQLERERINIRNGAPSLKPDACFYFKTIRNDTFNYYYQFINELADPNIRMPKRRGPKKNYRVTGEGLFRRHDYVAGEHPVKQPQYTTSEKKDHTKFQSTSLGLTDFYPPAFGFDKREILVGFLFDEKNILLSNDLYIYDGGTVNRPSEHYNEMDAKQYADDKIGKVLFSKNNLEQFKEEIKAEHNKGKYNEVLARLQWDCDGTSKIFIYTDNLQSRLLAKQFAKSLEKKLQEKGKLPPGHRVPICFYTPDKPDLLFKEYTEKEYALDCIEASYINSNIKNKEYEYKNNRYEFLYGLSPKELKQSLNDKVDGLPLPVHLLNQGYIHIFRFLQENSELSLESMLKQHIIDHQNDTKLILSILSHALRVNDRDLANHIEAAINLNKLKPITDNSTLSLLTTAIENNNIEWFGKLLKYNLINLDEKNEDGNNALAFAAYHGRKEIVKLILDADHISNKKKYVNTTNKINATPLYLAAQNNHPDIVSLLLNEGADINIPHESNTTPLVIAAKSGHLKIIDILLKHDADINIANKSGLTALHYAAKNGHLGVAKKLLEKGADITSKPLFGDTPFQTAMQNKHIAIARCINQHELRQFLNNIMNKPDNEYLYSLSVFSFSFQAGCSYGQIKEAAQALLMAHTDESSIKNLAAHKEALSSGELKGIYERFLEITKHQKSHDVKYHL